MVVDFSQPNKFHAQELAASLSLEDRRELLAQGVEVEWAIWHSIQTSKEAVAIHVDDELVCITGLCVHENLGGGAYPWLLATPGMQCYPRLVLKYSRQLIKRWLQIEPYMTNYVDARHHRAISWLTHLGASLEYLPEHGIYRRPFYKFSFGSEL